MSNAPPVSAAIPAAAERRIAPRRQPAMGTICRLAAGPSAKPAMALIWNISTTGVSMLVSEPPAAGAQLAGVLETVVGGHSLAVRMRVVHVKKVQTDDYFVGAHFDRPLADSEMKPFVV